MSPVDKIYWVDLQANRDPRGVLTAIEAGKHTPFEIRRVFYMHDITEDRGGHAHTDTDQMIVAVHGTFKVDCFDGEKTRSFDLTDPTKGLYVPRMIFTSLYNYSPGAVTLVLASTHYDMKKSLRTRQAFMSALGKIDV